MYSLDAVVTGGRTAVCMRPLYLNSATKACNVEGYLPMRGTCEVRLPVRDLDAAAAKPPMHDENRPIHTCSASKQAGKQVNCAVEGLRLWGFWFRTTCAMCACIAPKSCS